MRNRVRGIDVARLPRFLGAAGEAQRVQRTFEVHARAAAAAVGRVEGFLGRSDIPLAGYAGESWRARLAQQADAIEGRVGEVGQ